MRLHPFPLHSTQVDIVYVSRRQPIVTGTSVLAIKYKDGIMMAADTLGTSFPPFKTCSALRKTRMLSLASYGSLARFKDVSRLHKVGDFTVLGAGGDMSDFQYLQSLLDDLMWVVVLFPRVNEC